MNRRSRLEAARLLQRLLADPAARLTPSEDGSYAIRGGGGPSAITGGLAHLLIASGLLQPAEAGDLAVSSAAKAWLRRQADPDRPFRAQHQVLELTQLAGEEGRTVLVNRDESPVAALARRPGRSGEPWLAPHAVTAAERLRRDFETGRLQPHVTANWSASVNMGRRTGEGGLRSNRHCARSPASRRSRDCRGRAGILRRSHRHLLFLEGS